MRRSAIRTITTMVRIFTEEAPLSPVRYSRWPVGGWSSFPYTTGNMKHDITGDDNTLNTPKTVIDGNQLAPVRECGDDIGDVLGILGGTYDANGTVVTPYTGIRMSRRSSRSQLIQRFVTSNPSPPIHRPRCDECMDELRRRPRRYVLKAILTDSEARSCAADRHRRGR